MVVDIGVNVDRDIGRDVGVDQTAVLPLVFFDRLLHIEVVGARRLGGIMGKQQD
jgi:hypothetical protein